MNLLVVSVLCGLFFTASGQTYRGSWNNVCVCVSHLNQQIGSIFFYHCILTEESLVTYYQKKQFIHFIMHTKNKFYIHGECSLLREEKGKRICFWIVWKNSFNYVAFAVCSAISLQKRTVQMQNRTPLIALITRLHTYM